MRVYSPGDRFLVVPDGVRAVLKGVVVVGIGALAVLAFSVAPVVAVLAATAVLETNHLRVMAK
jgi:hypothetical protein